MKRLFVVLFAALILVGCSTDLEKINEELVTEMEGLKAQLSDLEKRLEELKEEKEEGLTDIQKENDLIQEFIALKVGYELSNHNIENNYWNDFLSQGDVLVFFDIIKNTYRDHASFELKILAAGDIITLIEELETFKLTEEYNELEYNDKIIFDTYLSETKDLLENTLLK